MAKPLRFTQLVVVRGDEPADDLLVALDATGRVWFRAREVSTGEWHEVDPVPR